MRELAELFQNLERTHRAQRSSSSLQNFYQGSIQTKQRPSPIFCAANWLRHLNRWKSAWPVELKQQ